MRTLVLSLAIITAVTAPARGQSEAPAGVRPTGMAGAFVAVADDASAVFWNPAGLAAGSYFSLAVDSNQLQTDDSTPFPHRRTAFMLALGTPAFGVSYVNTTMTRSTERLGTAGFDPGGNISPLDAVRIERLAAHHIGATVVQSLWHTVAVGATLKLVRGSASTGIVPTGDASAFEDAAALFPQRDSTKFDTDIGVMVSGAIGKAGLSVRNLFEPEFDTPDGTTSIPLERRIRGGVSLLLLKAIRVAADVDFTKASTSLGEWRDVAIGAEIHPSRASWVRSGVHWNAAGDEGGPGAAPIFSVGGSYVVHGSVLADAQYSMGSENGDRGWGVGLRFVF